jgi:uncharacterized membrane protein
VTLDPRWSIFLSLFLAILGVLGGSAAQFTDLGMDPHQVKAVLAIITMCLGIGNAINAVLGMVPSAVGQTKGFYLGPKQPDPAVKP